MEDPHNNSNNQELVIPEPLETPFAKPPSYGEISGEKPPAIRVGGSGKKILKFIITILIIAGGVIGGYFALSNYFPQYAKYVQPYLGPILDPVMEQIQPWLDKIGLSKPTNNTDQTVNPTPSPLLTIIPSPIPSPQITDSDGDGLSDIDEARYNTDPNNSDTDGDGYPDGEEVQNGYNPLGPGRAVQ